jgi:hypothetical protein
MVVMPGVVHATGAQDDRGDDKGCGEYFSGAFHVSLLCCGSADGWAAVIGNPPVHPHAR